MAQVLRRQTALTDLAQLHATARTFFEKQMSVPGAYQHGKDVLDKMDAVGLFEPSTLSIGQDASDSDHVRAVANGTLAATALFHTLSVDKIVAALKKGHVLPSLLSERELQSAMTGFDLHRELDTAERFDRVTFLEFATDPTNLGLLVRIADLAQTHIDVGSVSHLSAQFGGTPIQKALFYDYGSESSEALLVRLRRAAWVGRWAYAPLSEALGYPQLAGDLFGHYFDAFHPALKVSLRRFQAHPRHDHLLQQTQRFVNDFIRKIIISTLQTHGIEVEIHMRPVKHEGKLLGKAERYIRKEFNHSAVDCSTTDRQFDSLDLSGFKRENLWWFSNAFSQFVASKAEYYPWESFHDTVALQVVIKSVNGKPLDEFLLGDGNQAIITDPHYRAKLKEFLTLVGDYVKSSVMLQLYHLKHAGKECKDDPYDKPNGYLAVQYDFFRRGVTIEDMTLFPFEIQMHGETIYRWLNQGGAAHFRYLGGESELAAAARESIERGALASLRSGSLGNGNGSGKH